MNEPSNFIVINLENIKLILDFVIAIGAITGIYISIKTLKENQKQTKATHMPFLKLDSSSYKDEVYEITFDENGEVLDSNLMFNVKNVGSDVARGIRIYATLKFEEDKDSKTSEIKSDFNHIESTLGKDESVDISKNIYSKIGEVHLARITGENKFFRTIYLELDISYFDIFSQKYKTEFTISIDYKDFQVMTNTHEKHLFNVSLYELNMPDKVK